MLFRKSRGQILSLYMPRSFHFSLNFIFSLYTLLSVFHHIAKMQKHLSHCCLCQPSNACMLVRVDQDGLVDSGSLFRFWPWGMWLQGGEEMPFKVFNSTAVYLREDEEGGGKGNEMPSLS